MLEYLNGLPIGVWFGTKLVEFECSTDWNAYGKYEGLFLEYWLGLVVGLVIGFNKGTVLGFWDGKCLEEHLGI